MLETRTQTHSPYRDLPQNFFRRCKIIALHALYIVTFSNFTFTFVSFFLACITCHFHHCLHIFRTSFQQFVIHHLLFTIVHQSTILFTHIHTHKLTLNSGCYGPTDHHSSHVTHFLQPPAEFMLCSRWKFVPSKCLFLGHKQQALYGFFYLMNSGQIFASPCPTLAFAHPKSLSSSSLQADSIYAINGNFLCSILLFLRCAQHSMVSFL